MTAQFTHEPPSVQPLVVNCHTTGTTEQMPQGDSLVPLLALPEPLPLPDPVLPLPLPEPVGVPVRQHKQKRTAGMSVMVMAQSSAGTMLWMRPA